MRVPQTQLPGSVGLSPEGVAAVLARRPAVAAALRSSVRDSAAAVANQEPKRARWSVPPEVIPYLAERLNIRWDSYCQQLRCCQQKFSESTVHEFRVASRRLLAQLVMLNCLAARQPAERARRIVKSGLKALSQMRDAHVQRSFFEQQMTRFPALLLVRDELRRRERRLEKQAAARVKELGVRRLERCISALERQLRIGRARASCSERLTAAVNDAFGDVLRRRRAIEARRPETIHRVRVAFKKFRYMVESLSPEFTGLSKRDLRGLAYYQRRMGILQDLEIVQQHLAQFIREHRGIEPLLQPFARYLKQRRARSLCSFLKSADECYRFWPPPAQRATQPPAAIAG